LFLAPKKKEFFTIENFLKSVKDLTLYVPGFVAQGGMISEVAKVAGPRWHAIVGRAIYGSHNIRSAAKEITNQLFISETVSKAK